MLETKGERGSSGPLNVLVVGGGVAAAELLIALRTIARDRVDITLLCPQDELTYRPLSVVAPFGHDGDLGQSIDRLASDFDARRVKGSLEWVAPSAHTAYTDKRARLHYDVLVVATGARREAAFQYGLTFRGFGESDEMRALVEDVEHGRASRVAFVVPPGAAWSLPIYELALMTADRASTRADAELTVVTPEERPLAIFGSTASDDVASMLDAAGIAFE